MIERKSKKQTNWLIWSTHQAKTRLAASHLSIFKKKTVTFTSLPLYLGSCFFTPGDFLLGGTWSCGAGGPRGGWWPTCTIHQATKALQKSSQMKIEAAEASRFAFTDEWWDYVCFVLVFCWVFWHFLLSYIYYRCLFAWSMEAFMKSDSWFFWGNGVMHLTSTFALFAFVQGGSSWTEVDCFR